jgi:hypothetical protein
MIQHPLQIIIPILIALPILYLRLRRLVRTRELKPGQLFLWLAAMVVLAGLAIFLPQPGRMPLPPLAPAQFGWLGLAALVGGAVGWQMGRTIPIEVHPQNGTLMAKGSVAAMLVILVLVAVKLGLQPLLAAEGGELHLDARLVTDASLMFSVGLFVVRALEMYLRAQKVLAASGRN